MHVVLAYLHCFLTCRVPFFVYSQFSVLKSSQYQSLVFCFCNAFVVTPFQTSCRQPWIQNTGNRPFHSTLWVIGDILASWVWLRLLLQPVLSCHRDVGFFCVWHHSGSLARGSGVRNPSLRRSAMQCWVAASLAWSNHCKKFWEQSAPQLLLWDIPATKQPSTGWNCRFFLLFLCFFLSIERSACKQRADKEKLNSNKIRWVMSSLTRESPICCW